MTSPQTGPDPSPLGVASATPSSKSPVWLIVLIVTIGCVVLVFGVLFFLRDNGDGDVASVAAAAPEAPAGATNSVQLEPVSSASDPFAPPAGTDAAVKAVQTSAPTTVEAGRVGLYGGTMNYKQCDKAQLTKFLLDNPDKGAAWAKVLNITPDQIPAYVEKLTPVILRSDTAVTNHGFKNGQATTLQSVLQAGTAVLVDEHGLPVTKCYCGNPLQPPTFTSTTPPATPPPPQGGTTTTWTQNPPTYYGPEWPEWTPTSITIINVNVTVIKVFVLVDSKTGQTFERPAGTDGAQDKPVGAPAPTETTSTAPSNTGPRQTTTTRPYTTTTTTRPYTTTTTTRPYTTTTYPYETTTTEPFFPEDCVDELGNMVPCPGGD